MKTVGLITEYNPFHNGHKYHIEEAKRLSGADYVIAVMSGNFVQRGAPAVIDKYSRTEMALRNGIDLVLELPVCYATGSAEYFAHGAVSLLNNIGIVDNLCFGSESGDIELLAKAAELFLHPSEDFKLWLKQFLKEGMTYPAARLEALKLSLEPTNPASGQVLTRILAEPNNILGIEYLKALQNLQADIMPLTIQRVSNHYHDTSLAVSSNASNITSEKVTLDSSLSTVISSATAIRNAIQINCSSKEIRLLDTKSSVPADVFQLLQTNYQRSFPIITEDFSSLIKYKLLLESREQLAAYLDITRELADRLKNFTNLNLGLSELIELVKTKNVTLTRINRALIHLLLNIRTQNVMEYNKNGYVPYARVLGVRKQSTILLRKIEAYGKLPIITKVAKAKEQLGPLGKRMLSEDITAAHLYNQIVFEKYKTSLINEYKHGIILL